MLRTSLFAIALCTACGSGSLGGDDDDGGGLDAGADLTGLESIRVEPADQTLVISGDTPAESSYRAIGVFEGGAERDITAEVGFALADPLLGSFSGPDFTSQTERGGLTTVRAFAGSIMGAASLTLKIEKRRSDPGSTGLPADPGDLFDGPADANRAPSLVYPNDGVLVPPNLRKLELHFYPGTDNTVFALSFQNEVTDVVLYAECTEPLADGCIYTPDLTLWRWLADTNRGGSPLTWSVLGTDGQGTAVGTSGQSTISFSFDDIDGGLYYWTTSEGTAIMRFDFGAADQEVPEQFIDTTMTDGSCVGCHALSRDGAKMVTASNGSNGANVLLLDVENRTPIVPYDSTPQSAFSAWSPDGSRYVGVYGGNGAIGYDLNLFDGDDGSYLESIDVGGTTTTPANHPDWAPSADRIVYMKVGERTGATSLAQHVYDGAIEMVTGSGGTWSAPEVIIPAAADKNHYYPTFAPDGELIVFNQSTCGGSRSNLCDSYEDPSARLWLTAAEAGATPVELTAANAPGVADEGETELKSSFPKWSPFIFKRTGETGSRLMWVTFSSTRRYGLREPPGSNGTLIWMAAVDPDALGAGDPSAPSFALPFQDLTTSNHTAQWTTEVVGVD
jgi:Tol biopolymer transport system component